MYSGAICVVIYETQAGWLAHKCDSDQFRNLSRTLHSTNVETDKGTVFVKYPKWLPHKEAARIARNWAAAEFGN